MRSPKRQLDSTMYNGRNGLSQNFKLPIWQKKIFFGFGISRFL